MLYCRKGKSQQNSTLPHGGFSKDPPLCINTFSKLLPIPWGIVLNTPPPNLVEVWGRIKEGAEKQI